MLKFKKNSNLKKFVLFFLFFLPLNYPILAQKQNNIWYFGTNAGLDFNANPPISVTGSLQAYEGNASICDPAGNLLFYTNGETVWDRNHNIMPNGSGLNGGASATQPALIVPLPNSCNLYYIFTVEDHTGSGRLSYSILDMCLNSGLGDIAPLSKNILITQPVGEKLTAVKHSNGTGIWIITHRLGSNNFLAYLLAPSGLTTTPVVSSIGSTHPSLGMIGPIKASHDGSKLVISASFENICELFDFNPSTGQVSNFLNLKQLYSLPIGVYGLEFSPNDSLLYISTFWGTNYLYQLDLHAGVLSILNSAPGNYVFGTLQMGQDHKIYMARENQNFLDVINAPVDSTHKCDKLCY